MATDHNVNHFLWSSPIYASPSFNKLITKWLQKRRVMCVVVFTKATGIYYQIAWGFNKNSDTWWMPIAVNDKAWDYNLITKFSLYWPLSVKLSFHPSVQWPETLMVLLFRAIPPGAHAVHMPAHVLWYRNWNTKIEVTVVSPTTWEAHHSLRANSPSGCGELPRSLVTSQWTKSRYQILFYHDAPKHIKSIGIRVYISRKSLIKLLQTSHYEKHGHKPLPQQPL